MKRSHYLNLFVLLTVGALVAAEWGGEALLPPPAVPAVKDAVPAAAEPFDLSDIRLLDSTFKQAMETDFNYLLNLDPNRLLSFIQKQAGLFTGTDLLLGWKDAKIGAEGSDWTLGHYLSACSQMYRVTRDPRMLERVNRIVDELAKCQRAGGNAGLLVSAQQQKAFEEVRKGDIRANGGSLNGTFVPFYGKHIILVGLLDAYTLCGNARAREVLVAMTDWYWGVLGHLTQEQMQKVLLTEHGGMAEALANVYAVTGEPRHLALAKKFRHDEFFVPIAAGEDMLSTHHANTQVPKFSGYQRIHQLTGEAEWGKAADNFWTFVAKNRSFANGGNCVREHFNPLDQFDLAMKETQGPETCNSYNMLNLTRHLFAEKAEAEKMDYYERVIYNQILPSQHPKTGGFVYNTPLLPGAFRVYMDVTNHIGWCCVGTGMENHALYGASIYAHRGDRLFVNLFIPSELTWREQGAVVTQVNAFPGEARTRLQMKLDSPKRLTLAVRYPNWVEAGALKLAVNGQAVSTGAKPGTYAEVTREWRDGDALTVELPMALHTEMLPNTNTYVAVFYGPLLLGAKLGNEGLVEGDFHSGTSMPAKHKLPAAKVPAMVRPESELVSHIEPVAGKPLQFTTRGLCQPADVTLVPINQIYDERYSIYFPLLTTEQWKQNQQRWAAEEQRERELLVRTVDEVRCGEQQPEMDHRIKSAKSKNAMNNAVGHAYREAQNGWFSYEMMVDGQAPMTLSCTYWGSDKGSRDFDILVDGALIATQQINELKLGEFVEIAYPIPEPLTRGKDKVVVKFQSKKNRIAGGVYNCRILNMAPDLKAAERSVKAAAVARAEKADMAAEPYPERETIALQSASGHGGAFEWVMRKASETGDGGAISSPDFATGGWQKAVVPGTVLNSLVANGVYPEPYYGVNNQLTQKRIPDISETGAAFYTYWFRTTFHVPKSFENRRVWLQFDGINYKVELWLNGRKLGDMAGMFNRGLFDVTALARIGQENALAVLVHPIDPPNGFKQRVDTKGNAKNENRNGADGAIGAYVTMLMTCGWDFTFKDGIRDRNTGIWRDIKLFATGPVLLRNAFVKSELPLPGLTSSRETITVEVRNATGEPQDGVLKAVVAETPVTIQQPLTLQPHETRVVRLTPDAFPDLVFRNPRIWWPFNKGDQPLYHLKLSFEQRGGVSDVLKTRFGIRDIRSDQNTPEKSRVFYVNGKRYFVTGSNWIPEAMCRTSLERTRAELLYTRQSGVTFLRLWGGGITESDEFFDLCDELGILVWIEFWASGDTVVAKDTELFRDNVKDTVKRIRNHPSLAYYVSANERNARSIIPIKDILDDLDGTRGYQPGSETDGVHDGSPYGTCNPMWYYEDTGSDRGTRLSGFNPEYGTPILPTIDALREMMDEKDLWPINKPVWWYLDGDGFHGMTGLYDQAVRQYGPSASIEEYSWKAQMFGSLAYKSLWECWNAQRFEYGERFSTGVLFWYHNSPNRQTCGRLWDWSLEPTAALYASQSAHEPLHIQYDFLKNTVGVNNEMNKAFQGLTATLRILNIDMKEVYRKAVTVDVPADRFVKDILQVELPKNLTAVYFLKLTLADASGKVLSENFYWSSDKPYQRGRTLTGPLFQGMAALNGLPKATVQTEVSHRQVNGRNVEQVTVRNPSATLAFMVWVRLQDSATGKPVRPAFYDDNFFSLLPGESRTIRIVYSNQVSKPRLIVDGWNVSRRQYEDGKVTDLPDIRTIKPASLAQGKPVTASSSVEGSTPAAVTDFDSTSRWVSSRSDNQWIAIDLGVPTTFSRVGLDWEAAYATDYQIQVSDDGATWRDVSHVTNGTGGNVILKFEPVVARHVRMLGNKRPGPYGFSLFDFAVYP